MRESENTGNDVARFPLVAPDGSHLAGLMAVLRRLSTARTQQEIMEVVTQAARALVQADGVTFVLRDGDLCHYAEENAISPLWKGKRFPLDACISGWCMVNGRAAVIPDIYADPRIPHDAYRPTFVRSLAMVPVRQDNPVAAVGAYWARSREIASAELDLLQAIANAVALALSHVRLKAEHDGARGRPGRWPVSRWIGASRARMAETVAASVRHEHSSDGRSPAPRPGEDRTLPDSNVALATVVLCVALATAVRLALGWGFGSGLTAFATYFPAVLAATLIAGPSAGILALALGGIVAGSMFLGTSADGAARATNLVLYVAASLLIVWVAGKHRRALRSLRNEQNRRVILLEEMQHRMRNSLAVVQAVVNQSLLSSPAKARKINRRIAALVAGNDALGDAGAAASDLKAVVASELAPYGALCVEIEGPPVSLGPGPAQSLALAVHELATNAAKYGALSVPEGHVSVSWSVSGGHVRLVWSERGGPPVVAPEAGGFGTVFVERILAASGARIATDFRPDGLRCEILLPSGTGREPAGPVAEPPD